MKCSIFGTLKNRDQAERVVDLLKTAGFSSEEISVLFPDTPGTFTHTTKAPEGVTTGGTAGFVIGGVLGWLAGIGSLAIPGLGPFIAAGPILAALSGAAVGAALGGITGALVGMGIPEYVARKYEADIRQGSYFISVHTDDEEKAFNAREILRISNAKDIATSGEPGTAESLRTYRSPLTPGVQERPQSFAPPSTPEPGHVDRPAPPTTPDLPP